MEPTWHQNGAKWSQNGVTFRKKSVQKSNATKKREGFVALTIFPEKVANMASTKVPNGAKAPVTPGLGLVGGMMRFWGMMSIYYPPLGIIPQRGMISDDDALWNL